MAVRFFLAEMAILKILNKIQKVDNTGKRCLEAASRVLTRLGKNHEDYTTITRCVFYQPRSGMFMQKCRSKKKEDEEER